MSRIPRPVLDEVRERTDIAEVIQRHVALQRRGNSYVGLCPFHQEKTPSFHVIPHKHLFHCFGCQASGDVFKFLMQIEGVSFMEAVKSLALAAGVPFEERELTADEKKELKRRATTYDVLEEACRFFESCLWTRPEGAPGREYFKRRGLTEETLRNGRLGFAPDGWTALSDHLHRKGFAESLGQEVGLVRERQQGGGTYDFLRGRVIFPIRDDRSRVIAFGARILEGDGPKYLNTPESAVYEKSKVLYGLDRARNAIQKKNRVLVVEGYMDVLSLHQAGFEEAVATCGTALTKDHLEKLRRITHDVVALFDADEAGARAAEKSLPMFLEAGLRPSRLDVPGAKDPDELIREAGPEAMEKALESKVPLLEWWLLRKREQMGPGAASQSALVEAVLPLLRHVPPAVVSEVASVLKVNEAGLLERLRDVPRAPSDAPPPAPTSGWRPRREMVHVLWLVVHRRDQVADLVTRIDPAVFEGPDEVRGVVARLVAGEPVAAILSDVHDPGVARTLSAVVAREALYAVEEAADGLCQVLDAIVRPRRDAAMARVTEEVERAERQGDADARLAALRRRAELFALHREMREALKKSEVARWVDLLARDSSLPAP